MEEFFKLAQLTNEQIALIRGLELATGTHIMAFEPGPKIAALSDHELQKVKKLENELGATLIVFESE